MPPLDGEPPTPVASRALTIKSINKSARTVDFVASTDTIDSYGDRVAQNWKLDRYLANPVVLFGHNTRELPIGRAPRVEVVDGQLECTIEFADKTLSAKAEEVFQMVIAGYLKAVSVGFLPHSYRWEKEGDREVFVLDDNELYEISVVPVPANPDALAKMKSLAPRATVAATNAPETKHPGPPGEEHTVAKGQEEFAMTEKELRDALTAKEAELAASKKEAEAATLRAKALEAQTETLVKERDAALAETKTLKAAAIEAEVDKIVGKTITPAEKPMFVELAASNPDLFAKMVAQRSPLTQTAGNGASVLPTGPEVEKAAPTAGDPLDVSDIAAKLAD